MTPNSSPIVPGRSCGTCSLCCKLLPVAAFDKPGGTWCQHSGPRRGCAIHAARPFECRSWYCLYLMHAGLGEKWKPQKSGIVLSQSVKHNRLTIHVDPEKPNAWRSKQFYEQLKIWAKQASKSAGHLLVLVGFRVFVILPNKDVDLGFVGEDDVIVDVKTADGIIVDVVKIHKADPRAGVISGIPSIECAPKTIFIKDDIK